MGNDLESKLQRVEDTITSIKGNVDDFISVPTYYGTGTEWIKFKN